MVDDVVVVSSTVVDGDDVVVSSTVVDDATVVDDDVEVVSSTDDDDATVVEDVVVSSAVTDEAIDADESLVAPAELAGSFRPPPVQPGVLPSSPLPPPQFALVASIVIVVEPEPAA